MTIGEKTRITVASALLKWVHFQQDTLGEDIDLCYFRDTEMGIRVCPAPKFLITLV